MEPYFEPVHLSKNALVCPFGCHIQRNSGKELAVEAHWHYYVEMLFSLSGKARVFLNEKGYNFQEGDFIIINAREVHSIAACAEENVSYVVVKFDPEVLYTTTRTIFESRYILPITMAKSTQQNIFYKNEICETPIPSLIEEIQEEMSSNKYGFELAVRTHICNIFLWVLRNWYNKGLCFDTDQKLKKSDIEMLQQVFDYIDENYMNDVTAKDVSKICNLSYSYFSRQFKAVMGKTFTEYLNYIRITEAEKLLLTTRLNITEVATGTGFSNSSYFIQQFKQFKGISPRQFRLKTMCIKT